jgi:thiamine biosynthesis protein ThiS
MPESITLNGEPRDFEPGTTLRQLVTKLSLSPEKVAIELNRRLARARELDTPLSPGDEIEIVTFVGGGEKPPPPSPARSARLPLRNRFTPPTPAPPAPPSAP